MLNIPLLRSSRLSVQLKEIAMLDSIKLAQMPSHLPEKQTTFLLNSALDQADAEGDLANPLFWTVSERMLGVGHYIASMQDGDPDFSIGDNAKYSDYLQGDKQYQHDVFDIGFYEGDHWIAVPLLGIMAETIESLEGEIIGANGRMHWHLGCMACQLMPNDKVIDYHDNEYAKKILERMIMLSQFPESAFIFLLAQLNLANSHFLHLFNLKISEVGIVAQPTGGMDLPSARFPANSAITSVSQYLCGKSDLLST